MFGSEPIDESTSFLAEVDMTAIASHLALFTVIFGASFTVFLLYHYLNVRLTLGPKRQAKSSFQRIRGKTVAGDKVTANHMLVTTNSNSEEDSAAAETVTKLGYSFPYEQSPNGCCKLWPLGITFLTVMLRGATIYFVVQN